MKNITKDIMSFYNQISNDENHRYKSWEHCYSYFGEKNIDIDKASLHLAFYLASWGMYRGSSPLLWKDYVIHKDLIKELVRYKDLRNYSGKDEETKKIIELKDYIFNYYKDKCKFINGTKKEYKPSNILMSKILLGTLGCTPAYDRYFVAGLKKEKIYSTNFNQKSLKELYSFYKKNKKEFNLVKKKIKKVSLLDYPQMKLIDMYFWQLGYEEIK